MPSRIIIRDIEPYEKGWAWSIIWPGIGEDTDKECYRTGNDGKGLYRQAKDGSWGSATGTDVDLSEVRDHAEARYAIRRHWDRVLGAADV